LKLNVRQDGRVRAILKGMPSGDHSPLPQAYQAVARLERLSADSRWAHRASGLRGALLRSIAEAEAGQAQPGSLSALVAQGFAIVEQAAREMGDRP